MQKEKGKEIFQAPLEVNLSASIAKAQLKTLWLPRDAMTLMTYSAVAQHAIKTGALHNNVPNRFHRLINQQNLNTGSHLDFAMH